MKLALERSELVELAMWPKLPTLLCTSPIVEGQPATPLVHGLAVRRGSNHGHSGARMQPTFMAGTTSYPSCISVARYATTCSSCINLASQGTGSFVAMAAAGAYHHR
jgi:hypothetical protein